MEFVYPIRDEKTLFKMLHLFKDWNRNYYIAATIGINWGLRCSDILSLTVGDVVNSTAQGRLYIKNEIRLIEIKNHHERLIPISESMKAVLREHIMWLGFPHIKNTTPLIVSRNYRYVNGVPELKPLSRKRLWAAISTVRDLLGITDKLGTHTFRKTYVWQAWKAGERLDLIRKELGHKSIEYTERYAAIPLGMTQEIYDKVNFALPPEPKAKRKKRTNKTYFLD